MELSTGCVIVTKRGRGKTVRVVADSDPYSGLVWVKAPCSGDITWMEMADVDRYWRRDAALERKLAEGELKLPPHRNVKNRGPIRRAAAGSEQVPAGN